MNSQDFEIVDIVVMELVNERSFLDRIRSTLEAAIKHHSKFSRLIETIEYATPYSGHTYKLSDFNENIKTVVAVEILKHYWENYSNKEFDIEVHIPNNAHDLYIKRPKKEAEPTPQPVSRFGMPLMQGHTKEFQEVQDKFKVRMQQKRWIDESIKHLQKYQDGAWAWNTLRGKFSDNITGPNGSTWYPTEKEKELLNLFTLYVYQGLFKELDVGEFTKWNIPSQCRYLFEEKTFEEKPTELEFQSQSRIMRNTSTRPPHDDHLDAGTYAFASKALFQASERRFIHKFKPKEITMNKIETVVRINDADASDFSDDDIFDLIAKTEKDVEKLEAIKEKPKKLEAKIVKMQESIKELAKIVDERD